MEFLILFALMLFVAVATPIVVFVVLPTLLLAKAGMTLEETMAAGIRPVV